MNKNVADTFPKVEIMPRMYLMLKVTSCSGECSFSNHSHLALISTEYDILKEINFDQIIKEFARVNSRKLFVQIYLYSTKFLL